MNLWVIDSDSGINLLYKSFMVAVADEDIVSGFLTAFHHFSMEEFKNRFTYFFCLQETREITFFSLKCNLASTCKI